MQHIDKIRARAARCAKHSPLVIYSAIQACRNGEERAQRHSRGSKVCMLVLEQSASNLFTCSKLVGGGCSICVSWQSTV